MKSRKTEFLAFIEDLQNEICKALEDEDGNALFREDQWHRPGGGGGRTRILSEGKVFEKAGVNTSAVHGELPPSMQAYLQTNYQRFFACGISLVIHPFNPFVPTVHANYRYFELYDKNGNVVDLWFGGGADLTPYYLFDEDAIHFHSLHKSVCDQFTPELYTQLKKACDAYFFNHHRGEARGVGGLFFDRLNDADNRGYDVATTLGKLFIPAYLPLVSRRKDTIFTKEQKRWQEIRRGRYVEFNLLHDKGTLFGLKTNGRVESILMSLPATVRWEYDHHPQPGSPEERLLNVLKSPVDWV